MESSSFTAPPSVLGYQRISALMIDILGGREGESVALLSPFSAAGVNSRRMRGYAHVQLNYAG